MSHRAQRLVEGLAEAYRQAHPEEVQQPSAEEVEQAGVAALRAALYGRQPSTKEE